jgi:predicted AAA+ superfamily ATPase
MEKLWFQQLGFRENPFSIKPAAFGNKLVGYDHVIEELYYRVNAGGMVFIEGQLGTGKTSLLKLVASKYRGMKRLMYFSCNEIKNADLSEVLFAKIGFWRHLFNIKPKGMIVLLDEVNELGKDNVEKIKYFFDEDTIKSVVFTGVDYEKV